jgi:hypothetical protein
MNLKIGRRKCRLYKKDELVAIATKAGVPNAGKKTKEQLCTKMATIMNNIPLAKLYPQKAKTKAKSKNNIPLAKLYPGAANRVAAMRTPNVATIVKTKVVAVKKPMTKNIAAKRIDAMKMLTKYNKARLKHMLTTNIAPSKVVTLGREIARLK